MGGGVGLIRSSGTRGTTSIGGGRTGGGTRRDGGGTKSRGDRLMTEASGFGLGGSFFVVLAKKLTITKCAISENRTA